MYESRVDLIPWDVCVPVNLPSENFLMAAREWWCREREDLPCSIPDDCVIGVGHIMGFGAHKYPESDGRSWEYDRKYQTASGQFRSMMRHAYTSGVDAESGLPHEWHAMSRYMMLSALMTRGVLIDDRPPAALKSDEVRVPRGSYVTSGGDS